MVVNGWVWRCTQTRECVCLLVGEGEGLGWIIQNKIDLSSRLEFIEVEYLLCFRLR